MRELLGLQSFSPGTASVRAARRFVQQCLASTSLGALADDAGLLVSELAANAVLHARTDFDVAVSALHDSSGVRVTVRDDVAALPTVTAPSATAMSGRGLALVQTLASRWGAGPSSSARKGVWFELELMGGHDDAAAAANLFPADGPASRLGGPEPSVEDLLAAWSEGDPAPVAPVPTGLSIGGGPATVRHVAEPGVKGEREVVLPALDAADLLAAKESMDDMLRELQLVLLDPRDGSASSRAADDRVDAGPAADGLDLAHRLDTAARRFDAVRRQVRQQVSLAVASGEAVVRLRLVLPAGTRPAAMEFMAAVEAAEALADRGGLLSAGARALRRYRAVRRAYLGEVIAAADS
ncbi:ATP-binding protein [Quadrisphaera sp. KR29]|uniref:ATP-binding protein n=1 Tax=Quadrisphaera sp. KR29 TaxID=3461391 RepID=UPI0040450922